MARALAEHQAAARCRRVADLVPMHELAEDVDVLCQVRDRKPVLDVARLLEQEAEQVCHVLARLKRQHRDPPHQIPHQPALLLRFEVSDRVKRAATGRGWSRGGGSKGAEEEGENGG
eukprot:3070649-Rhodomonas_salina.2